MLLPHAQRPGERARHAAIQRPQATRSDARSPPSPCPTPGNFAKTARRPAAAHHLHVEPSYKVGR
eukprot:1728808-Prymnesium_polylepis.1